MPYANPRSDQAKAYQKEWYKRNRERTLKQSADRYAKNKEEILKRQRARYAANKEQIITRQKLLKEKRKEQYALWWAEYKAKNREKLNEKSKRYKQRNPEKVRATKAAWNAANRGKRLAYGARRRGLERTGNGCVSANIVEKLMLLQKGMCACCGRPLDDYELDHIMPLALGGETTDSNMQLLRKSCNRQKSAKHPIDFMQQRGFLL